MMAFRGLSSNMSSFSTGTLFSYYASITTFITLLQQMYHQIIPHQLRSYISRKLDKWLKPNPKPKIFTIYIDDDDPYTTRQNGPNDLYTACEFYLSKKLKSTALTLRAARRSPVGRKGRPIEFKLAEGETFEDKFEGVTIHWSYLCSSRGDHSESYLPRPTMSSMPAAKEGKSVKYFKLCCDPEHKDKVADAYLNSIVKAYDKMMQKKKVLRLFSYQGYGAGCWESVQFDHPFTFDLLALDPDMKRAVVDDVDRFMRRKACYKKVGRAWKRGYLLYGPPGTGKSSLIAAMANYLEFDIFDLQLSNVCSDAQLRKLLLSTSNKSILVIEDIDCSLGSAVCRRTMADLRKKGKDDDSYSSSNGSDGEKNATENNTQISLSGLLNFIDGLWSTCGDERIIIFTTNHRDRLDPALLRPGRMDMHIHMSYLTMPAFRVLAKNYLDIKGDHPRFAEIEPLLNATNVTPAQVAEQLIRSEDTDVALCNLVEMLKSKIKASRNQPQEKSTDDMDDLEVVNDDEVSSSD